MLELALRQIIGFLVQIVPCAALCLMPFSHRFVRGARRAYTEAALAVAVPLVPFTALVFVPFPEGASDFRLLAQNCVFIVSIALLLVVYLRNVRGSGAQKVFAFFSVACYGFVVTISGNAIIGLGFENPFSDEYLYQPISIVMFALVGAVLFVPMTIAMRTLGQLFEKPIDADTWRLLAALPAAILVVMLAVSWLPGLVSGIESSYYLALVAMSIMVVAFLGGCCAPRAAWRTTLSARRRCSTRSSTIARRRAISNGSSKRRAQPWRSSNRRCGNETFRLHPGRTPRAEGPRRSSSRPRPMR